MTMNWRDSNENRRKGGSKLEKSKLEGSNLKSFERRETNKRGSFEFSKFETRANAKSDVNVKKFEHELYRERHRNATGDLWERKDNQASLDVAGLLPSEKYDAGVLKLEREIKEAAQTAAWKRLADDIENTFKTPAGGTRMRGGKEVAADVAGLLPRKEYDAEVDALMKEIMKNGKASKQALEARDRQVAAKLYEDVADHIPNQIAARARPEPTERVWDGRSELILPPLYAEYGDRKQTGSPSKPLEGKAPSQNGFGGGNEDFMSGPREWSKNAACTAETLGRKVSDFVRSEGVQDALRSVGEGAIKMGEDLQDLWMNSHRPDREDFRRR